MRGYLAAAVSAPPVSVLSAPQAVRARGATSAARRMKSLVISVSFVTGPKYNPSRSGVPRGIRTHDPQLRRLLLYPAEL